MRQHRGEEGVSEVIGVMLLVGVTVLAVAIVAVVFLSGPQPGEIPHATIVAGNKSGSLVLAHEGGDPLREGEYRIYVDTGSGLMDGTRNFTEPEGGIWSIGGTLAYNGTEKLKRVVVTAISGGSETILAEPEFVGRGEGAAGFSPDPVEPEGMVMPAPTPELVTIVLPETGGNLSTKQQEFVAKVNASNTAYVHMILYALNGVGSAGNEATNQMIVMNMTPSKTIALFYNHTVQNINFVQQGSTDMKVSMTVIAYDANNTPIASAVEIGILKKHNSGG